MRDTYAERLADLDAYAAVFPWQDGQVGVLCGIGGHVACADLFDHPETLRRLYPSLVRSYALDALWAKDVAPDEAAARHFVAAAGAAAMTVHPGVGLGREVRLTAAGVVGSALVADGRVVHAALFSMPTEQETEAPSIDRPSRRRRRPDIIVD